MKPYFDKISERIIDELNKAEHEIRVAVAWISDNNIINTLAEKARQGIKVEILISAKTIDEKYKEKSNGYNKYLFLNKCLVYKIGIDDNYAPTMHHKFCIIDNHIIITGSFNWTNKATSNDEDIIITDNFEFAQQYIDRFKELKQRISKERLWFNQLEYSWQQKFKEVIGIDHEPTEKELNMIVNLIELDISADPLSLREELEDEYYNESVDNVENLTEENKNIFRLIAHVQFKAVNDLSPLSFLKNLQVLNCSGTDIKTLNPLSDLIYLEKLNISDIWETTFDIEHLKHLKNLKSFVCANAKLKNWESIKYLVNLEELQCGSIDKLRNEEIRTLEPLKNLTQLKSLDISGFNVSNLEPLCNLIQLKYLDISGLNVSDIKTISNFKKLKTFCADSTLINDISPLFNLKALRTVHIHPDNNEAFKKYEENLKLLEENNFNYGEHKRKQDKKTKQAIDKRERFFEESAKRN